jgi:hypothetical protein
MAQRTGIGIVLVVGLLLTALAAGCGGGDSSGSEGSKNASGGSKEATSTAEPESFFKTGTRPGRKVYGFGEEANDEEREAASTVLEEEYDARAAGEWAKQCALMTFEQSEEVRETTVPDANCAKGLRIQATPLAQSRAFRANPISGPIDAFRVEGENGFILYRGKDGKDYAMLMRKEDSRWKVDDLTPTQLPES